MIRRLITAAAVLGCTSAAIALTDSWSVNVRTPAAVQRTVMRGESWDFTARLFDGLAPLSLTNATATFYWYTNAVQNVWWTNAASVAASGSSVSFSWTPAMDVGASAYPFWVGVWASGATSPLWRVSGTIRVLGSPGLVPNSLPLPRQSIDFASITVTNAPWAAPADLLSLSNALASAVQALPGYPAVTNVAAAAAAAERAESDARYWRTGDTNGATTVGDVLFSTYDALPRIYLGTRYLSGPWGVDILDGVYMRRLGIDLADLPQVSNIVAAAVAPLPTYPAVSNVAAAAVAPLPTYPAVSNIAAAAVAPLPTYPAVSNVAAAAVAAIPNIPGPGCTDLGATNGPAISGATVAYTAAPTTAYTLSVSASAPRYCYAVEIIATNACTLAAGLNLRGSWTITGTNILTLVPGTGTVWNVYGMGL